MENGRLPREPSWRPPYTPARPGAAVLLWTDGRSEPPSPRRVYWAADTWDPLELGTAVLRIVFGLMLFFLHGLPNVVAVATFLGTGVTSTCLDAVVEMGMPAPMLAAALAAAALFLGGLLVAAGFLTRPSAAVLTGILCGALVENLMSDRDPQIAGLYVLVAVTFAIGGGGRYSLDAVLFGRRLRSRGRPFDAP